MAEVHKAERACPSGQQEGPERLAVVKAAAAAVAVVPEAVFVAAALHNQERQPAGSAKPKQSVEG